MYLPMLSPLGAKGRRTAAFRGLDRRVPAPDAFFEMQNMTSDAYPALSPRKPPGRTAVLASPNGLAAGNGLCWADGTDLYYNGTRVGQVTHCEKRFALMGSRVLIWPDKLCYDTAEHTLTPLQNTFVSSGRVDFTLTDGEGTAYSYTPGDAAPKSPEDGEYWLDTSALPHSLKRYSGAAGMWVAVLSACIRIAAQGVGAGFAPGDGVRVSGCVQEDFNRSFVLEAVSAHALTVSGTLDMAFYQTEPLTVSREVPDLEFIMESDNRLWGCSSAENAIYGSKLGDPGNWNCFSGLSTDSYALTVGSPGDFTGCAAYGGALLFFKEDMLHKLLGTKPANYQLISTPLPGVERGAHKTLAVADSLLFYKARDGVCAYGGAQPELISHELGGGHTGVCGGALGSKYYVCLKKDGAYGLYVYDAARGLWHREDGAKALCFAALNGELYFLDGRDGGLWCVGGGGGTPEEDPVWSAETGPLSAGEGKSRLKKIVLRLDAEAGAEVRVGASFDGGPYHEQYRRRAAQRESRVISLLAPRADAVRIRISGRGRAAVYGLTRYLERSE